MQPKIILRQQEVTHHFLKSCFWSKLIYDGLKKTENDYNGQKVVMEFSVPTETSRIIICHDFKVQEVLILQLQ